MLSSLNLDAPSLTGRIGGPRGRHARMTRSIWFDPVPWAFGAAVVAWLIAMLRHGRCLGTDPENQANPFTSLCYSDITVLYRNDFWAGSPLYGGDYPLPYPPLSGGLIWLTRTLTSLLGGEVSPTAEVGAQLHASTIFFSLNAIILFACFIVLVWAHLRMLAGQGLAVAAAIDDLDAPWWDPSTVPAGAAAPAPPPGDAGHRTH